MSAGESALLAEEDDIGRIFADVLWHTFYCKRDPSSYRWSLSFLCSYEKGWMEEPVAASIAGNPLNKPDKPTTYHMPYSRYRINVFQPPPPEPYED